MNIDWLDEALECGWPLPRIEALAEAAATLQCVATFIHADVIVLDREQRPTPYPTRNERFVAVRDAGTADGTRRANDALDAAGMERAA